MARRCGSSRDYRHGRRGAGSRPSNDAPISGAGFTSWCLSAFCEYRLVDESCDLPPPEPGADEVSAPVEVWEVADVPQASDLPDVSPDVPGEVAPADVGPLPDRTGPEDIVVDDAAAVDNAPADASADADEPPVPRRSGGGCSSVRGSGPRFLVPAIALSMLFLSVRRRRIHHLDRIED